MTESPLRALRAALNEHETFEDAASAVAADAASYIVRWRGSLRDSELDVLDRWADALACPEALHVACWAVGLALEEQHLSAAREADDARVNVLRRLWAASMEVGGECVALLRAGYASGALARWRLLRETEVLALFLIHQRSEVSEGYLDHARVQTLRTRRDYQRWARSVGEERFSDAEMQGMDEAVRAMVSAHGEAWAGDYGWAHEALLLSSRDYARAASGPRGRPRGPTFADLEAGVGQRASKLLYASASETVHFTLLAMEDELPGLPRPDAIDIPGARVAAALPTATAMFVLSWPPEDSHTDYRELAMLLRALSEAAAERFAGDGPLPGRDAPARSRSVASTAFAQARRRGWPAGIAGARPARGMPLRR